MSSQPVAERVLRFERSLEMRECFTGLSGQSGRRVKKNNVVRSEGDELWAM